MKTIESCEMSSPSPPRLDDPDLKMSQNGDEEVIKTKNGLNEDQDKIVESEKINGDLKDKEDLKQNESNGTKDESDDKSEQILHDDNNIASPTNNSGITEENSEENEKSPHVEEEMSSPDQSIDKENNIEKQQDAQEQAEKPEAMETDSIPAGDSKCEEEEKKETPSESSITKEPETKLPEKDIQFEISQELLERRRAAEQAKKEAEEVKTVKKPEAILELVEGEDTEDSETEDSDNKTSTSKSSEQEDSKKEEEPPKDDTDYNEALENLSKIQAESKKINDDEILTPVKGASGGALKRPASTEDDDQEIKRVKLELESTKKEIKSDEDLEPVRDIKKKLKHLTREQLENIVTEKMAEVISARSEIGDLRRKVDSYEQENERWKKKQQLLQKMCTDLNTVMKRYIVDKQNQQKDKVAPIKITRSVGLQVVTDRQRRTQGVPTAPKPSTPVVKTSPRPILPAGSIPTSPGRAGAVKTVALMNGTNVHRVALTKPQPLTQMAPVSSLNAATSVAVASPGGALTNSNAARLHTLPASVSIIQTPTASSAAVTSTPPNKAAASPTSMGVASKTTPTPASSPTTTATKDAKKVIDIVDLSDDEDQTTQRNTTTTVTTIRPQPTNGIRLVPASQLRGNNGLQVNKPGGTAPTYTLNSGGGTPPFTPTPQHSRPLVTHQLVRVPKHPAPLPDPPRHQIANATLKGAPPRPTLKISRLTSGIVLSWNMTISQGNHAVIASYQIYAYQETPQQKADSTLWKKVGDVKALPLPMACTLTQFLKGNKYHFAVRAKDVHTRVGHFSEPQSIALT